MRIFCKHLLRDILRFPLRVILIVLTISLSTAIAVSAFGIREVFTAHAHDVAQSNAELGDIIVSPTNNGTRIIFENDTKEALAEDGAILGEFSISAFTVGKEQQLINISATDLVKADCFYRFEYIGYSGITERDIDRCAIVSESAANKLGIHAGDDLSLSILGEEVSYRVAAVARDKGLLAEKDMLISIDGAKHILAAKNPVISMLGESIQPYTRLIVKLNSQDTAKETAERIRSSLEDSALVTLTENAAGVSFSLLIELGSLTLMAILIVFLCATLIASSLNMLHQKRRREYALFALAGASQKTISALKFAESIIYSAVAPAIGLPLAQILLPFMASKFIWNDITPHLGAAEIILGIFFAPLIMIPCTAFAIKRERRELSDDLCAARKKISGAEIRLGELLPLLAVLLIAVCVMFILPTAYKYIPSIVAIAATTITIYLLLPSLIKRIFSFIAKKITAKHNFHGGGILLLRGFENIHPLKQVCRLLTVLITIFIAMYTCTAAVSDVMSVMERSIYAEYAVINADDRIKEKLLQDDRISSITDLSMVSVIEKKHNYTLNALSASGDTEACISDELIPRILLEGNEVAISSNVEKICDISVGDELTVIRGGAEYTLTVKEIYDSKINSIFVNAETLNISEKITAVKLSEEVSPSDDIRRWLAESVEAYGATVTTPKVIFGTKIDTANGFIDLLQSTLIISVILVAIGFSDTLSAHYKGRRKEYSILRISGMTKKQILGYHISEIATVVAVSLILALPISLAVCCLLDLATSSFGFSILTFI